MKLFLFFLVLTVITADAKRHLQRDIRIGGGARRSVSNRRSADASIQVEGCSLDKIEDKDQAGPSGGGSANAGGSANGVGGSAEGNVQVGGCSLGAGVEGSGDGNSASGNGQISASGCDYGSKNYTYTIKAKRTDQLTPPGYPVVYLYYQISDPQNMTYFENIDSDNPFVLDIAVLNNDYTYESDPNNLPKTCGDCEDGTWEYVAVKIIQGGLMPDGKCPVKQGNYNVPQSVDPITVTFVKKIPCGDYDLYANLYRGDEWSLQVGYSFTIDNNDDCIPQGSK